MDDQNSAKDRQQPGRLGAVLRTLLPTSRLGRNAVVVSSGHLAGYGVLLLTTPLLTRLYTPADFGVFAVYTAIISLGMLVGTLRYEAAIPLPSDHETASRLVVLALGACGLTSLLAALTVWCTGQSLLVWFKAAELATYWPIFALHLCAVGSYETLAGWSVRREAFGPLARSRFTVGTATALGQLAAWLLVGGFAGLILGSAAGSVVGVCDLAIGLRRDRSLLGQIRSAEVWSVAVRYRRFPQYSVLSSLVQKMTVQLAPLALAALYEPTVVGWFALAHRTLVIPLSLVGVPLSRVYMSEASRIHREGIGRLRRLFSRTLRKQLLFAGIPLGLFSLVAPWIFHFAFGPNWREAGLYCSLLAPMLVLYVTNVVLATTLEVLERLELQLQRSLVSLACIAAGIVLPKTLGMPPRAAILMLSLASSLGYLYTLWTTWRAIPPDTVCPPPDPHAFRVETRTTLSAPLSGISAPHAATEVQSHV